MDQIMEVVQPAVLSIATACVTCIGAYVASIIKKYFKSKIDTQEKKDVVKSTVRYVEQVFKDLHGDQKLDTAKEVILSQLNEKGITITDTELTVLIESAVNAFNSELNK